MAQVVGEVVNRQLAPGSQVHGLLDTAHAFAQSGNQMRRHTVEIFEVMAYRIHQPARRCLGVDAGIPKKRHGVQVGQLQSLGLQAKIDGLVREGGIVLEARKALFLAGRDDPPVDDQRGGGVVGVIDAQDFHVPP
jgi:hypothetical protein